MTSAGPQCTGNKLGAGGGALLPDGTFAVVLNAMTVSPTACVRVEIKRFDITLASRTVPEAEFRPVSAQADTSLVVF
jgi:hypothetical protein